MTHILATIEAHPRLGRYSARLCGVPLIGRLWRNLCDNPKELDRFIKFATVGAIGAMVDFAVLNVMKLVLEHVGFAETWHGSVDPHTIQLVVANAISFSVAVASNFTWNRLWTFPESRELPIGPQLVQFAIVNILGLIINTVLLVVMDEYVFSRWFDPRVSYNLAKAFAICVVLFWNFSINRIWTYRGIK